MKRFFTLLAAAVVAALPLAAIQTTEPAPDKTETKEYRLSGFTGLEVSSIYHVQLSRAARHAVKVEAPEFILPYLRVEVKGGVLQLGLLELPRDIQRRLSADKHGIQATVAMPELVSLRMSGASKLDAGGEFSTRKKFEFDLSGATGVRGLSVKAPEAEIRCGGASKFFLAGSYDKLKAELSGSAGGNLGADIKTADIQLTGAAKLACKGTLGTLDLEASGAANYKQEGALTVLDIEASGAAKIQTSDVQARSAKVRLSGAAGAIIDVQEELDATLSGASSLRYRAGDKLRITGQNVSRGASIASFR